MEYETSLGAGILAYYEGHSKTLACGSIHEMKKKELHQAGMREIGFCQNLIKNEALPIGFTMHQFLEFGTYDPVNDEVSVTVNGIPYSWKVG